MKWVKVWVKCGKVCLNGSKQLPFKDGSIVPPNGNLSFQFSLRSWLSMRRMIQVSRTDDNRLVYIRVSNPHRTGFVMILSEQPSLFESSSKDISELVLLHKSKKVIYNMFGKYINLSLSEGDTIWIMNCSST